MFLVNNKNMGGLQRKILFFIHPFLHSGKENEGGRIVGFVSQEQKDVEVIYKLMV